MGPRKSRAKKVTPLLLPGELPASALHAPCNPDSLGFQTTAELPDLVDVLGQPRVMRALQLGSEVTGPGYNIFVLGMPSSGRTTLSREYLERKAAHESVPSDWCYVYNFENERQPRAICLPAGRGGEFRKDIQTLIASWVREIPILFQSEEYVRERDRLASELKKEQEARFLQLQKLVELSNFLIMRTTTGFVLVPAVDGKPIQPDALGSLTPAQREQLGKIQDKLSEDVEKTLNNIREREKNTYQQIQTLNSRTIHFLIDPLIEALRIKYTGLDAMLSHLEAIKTDITNIVSQFHFDQEGESNSTASPFEQQGWGQRYEVNLLVDHSKSQGAPVITENYPSYGNLLGRIEHEMIMGGSRTDFTMIRPGALHRANGGYLIIPARDMLLNPYAWEGLKRALRDRELRIVELSNQLGALSTSTLEPEPIPLQIKILLIGTPTLYYTLCSFDEDFPKLFKVRAEFASLMDRTAQNEQEYGLFINSVVQENNLPAFDKKAVARVIEYSSRLVDHQTKLSTRFGKIADLVREAAYWASKSGQRIVSADDVQQAIDESIYRNNLVEERLQELIQQDVLKIEVSGKSIGQINALSVFMLGDYDFGRPSRLTAAAYPGKAGVVDIERQAKLGGSLHTKGVLILSGFLNSRYGREQPLNLSASLTFEQSYDEIQGDSASAAELLALLSAIAKVPLRQDRAITGSVNQHGQLQAIGGVNEKIEGFYAISKAKGLSNSQGVIIPQSNQCHLMLNTEVIDAVSAGKFHVWAIKTIEEAICLLTDLEAGEIQPDGAYKEGTFNNSLMKRLGEYAKAMSTTSNKNTTRMGEQNGKDAKEG